MRPNIGTADQTIRMSLGLVLAALGALVAMHLSIAAGTLLMIAGAFSAYEATIRWCVVYEMLGKNTCKASER